MLLNYDAIPEALPVNTTPQSLQELAQAAIDRQGMSARQIALKVGREGKKLTYTTLNQMRSGTYKSVPRADTLRTLAWLAGVSEEVAFTAAGQPVPGPPLADELPDGADHLSPKSRRAIIDMVRVLIDLETTHDKHATTTTDSQSTSDLYAPADGFSIEYPEGKGHRSQDDRPDAGAGQKTPVPAGRAELDQMDFDLAAHPDMPLERDRFDAEHGDAGEENQDDGV